MTDATPTEGHKHQARRWMKSRRRPPPENMSISLRCFDTEEHARAFGDLVATSVRSQALPDLDRGCDTKLKLTPSEGIVLGVAMTPAVIRDGKIKSHMLFNAASFFRSKTRKTNSTNKRSTG